MPLLQTARRCQYSSNNKMTPHDAVQCEEWQHSYVGLRQLSRAAGWTICQSISYNNKRFIFVFSETSGCSEPDQSGGIYFSRVKRSERKADRSAVSVHSHFHTAHCSTDQSVRLYPVPDKLSNVATGNLQSAATHLMNDAHTRSSEILMTKINTHPVLLLQIVTVRLTVMSCRFGSYALLQLRSARAYTRQTLLCLPPNASPKLCRSSIDSDVITQLFSWRMELWISRLTATHLVADRYTNLTVHSFSHFM